MKLDRLKEIAVDDGVLRFPSRHMAEYGEVMKALPGLLRVCDAYIEACAALHVLGRRGTFEDGECEAKKKLEELL